MTTIGNSGFGYTKSRVSNTDIYKVRIYNLKTNETLFILKGGYKWSGRGRSATKKYYKEFKKFFGIDKKYYYIKVNSIVDWGQIQSDGAVLRSNRTILTVLAFFPNYEKLKTNVPVKTPIIITKPPNIPKIVTMSKTTLSTKTAIGVIPDTPPIKDKISWIQKIIKKIIDWMKKILNH